VDELRQFPELEPKFFTLSAYSLLLGGLNLNTITVKVPSPLGTVTCIFPPSSCTRSPPSLLHHHHHLVLLRQCPIS
jgi:hypothetical protein